MKINWWVVLISSIWLSAALGSFRITDGTSYFFAFLVTFFIGIGYFLLKII